MPDALSKNYGNLNPKVDRLLNVWEERKIFTEDEIANMKASLEAEPKPLESIDIAPQLKQINDLFVHLNKLNDINQENLTQMGIQSKTYLYPQDPETLPPAPVYLSKLYMLEKLGNVCINNVEEIKETRMKINSELDSLFNLIIDGTKTDDSKIANINEKYKSKGDYTRCEFD